MGRATRLVEPGPITTPGMTAEGPLSPYLVFVRYTTRNTARRNGSHP